MDMLTLALAIVAATSIYLALRQSKVATEDRRQRSAIESKYGAVLSIDTETERARHDLLEAQNRLQDFLAQDQSRRSNLEAEYAKALSSYEQLRKEVTLLEENLEDMSFGVYKPHFTFESAEDYRRELEALRDRTRKMIRENKAASCEVVWTVGNSTKDGERMTKQYLKLCLRAFNGECDAALANVSWNNITRMEERVKKAYGAINELGGVMKMRISTQYLQLRLDELRLSYEYEQKKQQEKEEQRRIREEMREEERAQREFEKAKDDAEREEERFQRALEKARAEVASATGAQLEKLTKQIQSFELKLDEARKTKERAIARAQLTKSGFVYVISNIGSFGERIYKIGMTRRMEPMERIVELGDASVPFPFDVHAILYSDNAPELERSLHTLFQDRSVNLVNIRKEFFREIDLDEIEHFVKERGLSAQFQRLPEAREYRQTLAIREERVRKPQAAAINDQSPPSRLFNS